MQAGSCGGSGNSAWTIGSGKIYNATSTDLVGIGTITPTTTLFVQGAGGVSPFAIASSTGAQLVTVDQNGNVGIGTTGPITRFTVNDVHGVFATDNQVQGAPVTIYPNSVGAIAIFRQNSTATIGLQIGMDSTNQASFNSGNADYIFQVSGSEKMRLTKNGHLGIGTSTPSSLFVVASASGTIPTVLIQATSSQSSALLTVASSSGASYLTVGANGSTTLSSLGTGCVGVSSGSLYTTTCGGGSLSIGAAISGGNQGSILFVNAGAVAQDAANFWDATNHRLGINSTTPFATVAIQGSSTAPTLPIFSVASSSSQTFLTVLAKGRVGVNTTTQDDMLAIQGTTVR